VKAVIPKISVLALMFVLIFGEAVRAGGAGDIEVVFLAGEGFMISCGHSRVLIDALFDLNDSGGRPPRAHDHLPPDGIGRLRRAEKPFDRVDAVLVTHAHDDHFTPGCAADYMRANGWAVLAGTREVTGALSGYTWLSGDAAARLITADPSPGGIDTFVIDGLTIYALGISHTGCGSDPAQGAGRMSDGAPCMEHVAWLIESGGRRILHLGDAKLAAEEFERFPWLPGLGIDVAFVPFWFLHQAEGADVISRLIAPKAIVLMHWNSWNRDAVVEDLDRNRDNLPPAVIFGEAFEKMSF
jgi:L-ascorbate metabolism protein UlaG (beta-lactamase superfamily)